MKVVFILFLFYSAAYSQDSLSVYKQKADSYLGEQLYSEAANYYTKALSFGNPDDRKAILEKRGLAYYLDKNYQLAIKDFSYVIDSYKKEKSISNIFFLRAACRASSGDNPGACEDLKSAKDLGHDHTQVEELEGFLCQ
ncbi:hypothetical protein OGH69_08290 [Flavobacterium sp. MFBS3-15]|uniref:hypothetical protein n=1 Tax=Flavobacterium sp. MFBS3-15 TaxID=2989816 RepID=UPI002236511C|nr:hypothetical protein [Flavobacterium sp. MFBS3-15]MCW4468958.1 hypothetical protein [Flavobacterium sp. MFBS3-15]